MIANEQFAPDRYERTLAAIHTLIADKKIGRYALFHEVGEGRQFPDGSEEMSGGVVDEQGRVYTFWTDWDAEHSRARFTTWDQIEPEPALAKSQEYLDARAEVGLLPLPGEDFYVETNTPDGVTHVFPAHWLKEKREALAVLIFMAIMLGVERAIQFVRRKKP